MLAYATSQVAFITHSPNQIILQGLVQMWQSSMVINLTSPNLNQRVSETFASTLGIVISFVAVGASITIATMMDYFRKKMKLAICSLLAAAGFIFIFCTLIAEEVIAFESHNLFKGVLSTLLVLGISLCSACAPIAFEFCVELCYPTAEGTIGGTENIFTFQLQAPGSHSGSISWRSASSLSSRYQT